jgi:hypothetical protein
LIEIYKYTLGYALEIAFLPGDLPHDGKLATKRNIVEFQFCKNLTLSTLSRVTEQHPLQPIVRQFLRFQTLYL